MKVGLAFLTGNNSVTNEFQVDTWYGLRLNSNHYYAGIPSCKPGHFDYASCQTSLAYKQYINLSFSWPCQPATNPAQAALSWSIWVATLRTKFASVPAVPTCNHPGPLWSPVAERSCNFAHKLGTNFAINFDVLLSPILISDCHLYRFLGPTTSFDKQDAD